MHCGCKVSSCSLKETVGMLLCCCYMLASSMWNRELRPESAVLIFSAQHMAPIVVSCAPSLPHITSLYLFCNFSLILQDVERRTLEYTELFANPLRAAERGFIDDIIKPSTTRQREYPARKRHPQFTATTRAGIVWTDSMFITSLATFRTRLSLC